MIFKKSYKITVILFAILLFGNLDNIVTAKARPTLLQKQQVEIENTEEDPQSVEIDESTESEETTEAPETPEIPEPSKDPEMPKDPEIQKDPGTSKDPEPSKDQKVPEIKDGFENLFDGVNIDKIPRVRDLLPDEVVVTTFQQLKDALANNNGIEKVYLGNDIALGAGGIKINTAKKSILIEGIDPTNPDQSAPYTLTDYYVVTQPASQAQSQTIYANGTNSALSSIHVRNLIMRGSNPFGPISIYNETSTQNIVVTYESIQYTGITLAYHVQGSCRFIDVEARIAGTNATFSVAKNVYIASDNIINVESSAATVFSYPIGGDFIIADHASLEVNSAITSNVAGVFSGYSAQVKMSIGENAAVSFNLGGKILHPGNGFITQLLLKESSYLLIKTDRVLAGELVTISGDVTVKNKAQLIIEGVGVNEGINNVLLKLGNGKFTLEEGSSARITGNGYYRQLIEGTGGTFLVRNTARAIFQNRDFRVFGTVMNDETWDIEVSQINYWNSINTIDNKPIQTWRKADGSLFKLQAKIAFGYGGTFKNMSSNFVPGVDPGVAPTPVTFDIQVSRIIAFGGIILEVDPIAENSKTITGQTEPYAKVSAWFIKDGTTYTFPDVQASSSGGFIIPSGQYYSLKDVDYVYVMSSNSYFNTTEKVPVQEAQGELKITIPSTLSFATTKLSSKEKRVGRADPNWEIEVEDGRGAGSSWTLKARLETPLSAVDPSIPDLEGELFFVNKNNTVMPIRTDSYTEIDAHTTTSKNEITKIQWQANQGVLVYILPGKAFVYEPYRGSIEWILEDAP